MIYQVITSYDSSKAPRDTQFVSCPWLKVYSLAHRPAATTTAAVCFANENALYVYIGEVFDETQLCPPQRCGLV